MGKTRDLQENQRYQGRYLHAKMGSVKDRNSMDLIEDIKKRWQEYTEELYQKDPHKPDNHDDVITLTHLEPDILECKSSGPQEASLRTKLVEVMEFQLSYWQILKDDAVKVLHSICQQIWKTWQWPQDWKMSVFIPIPKKGNAKECSNYHIIALIPHASKVMLKFSKPGFSNM